MKKSFYAVKNGHKPGVYTSWAECQTQVKGFKGADFKGFASKEEATSWLNGTSSNTTSDEKSKSLHTSLKDDDIYRIFVDGSYNKNTKHYGAGVAIYKGLSLVDEIAKGDIDNFGSRNVTGELVGSMLAMQYAKRHNIKYIELYFDYMGIEKWITGEWKAHADNAKQYVSYTNKMLQHMHILFVKVAAHSNHHENDHADRLAKQGCGL